MARFWLQSLLHNFIFRRCTVPSRVASLRRASQPKTRTQCRSSVRAQSLWNIPAATQKSISLPERVYLKGIGNGIGPYSASHSLLRSTLSPPYSQYKLGGKALHTIRKTRRCHTPTWRRAQNAVCLNGVSHDDDRPDAASSDASNHTFRTLMLAGR